MTTAATASKHCRHCHPDCQGGQPVSEDDPSIIGHDSKNEKWAATWLVCPACDVNVDAAHYHQQAESALARVESGIDSTPLALLGIGYALLALGEQKDAEDVGGHCPKPNAGGGRHCRHCSERCQGGVTPIETTWHMTADALVRWHPKRGCPMCAGAEEAAEAIEAEEALLKRQPLSRTEFVSADHRGGMLRAARIARS